LDLELLFNLMDLGDDFDAFHPISHVRVAVEDHQLFRKDSNAVDLAEDLQIVASDDLAAEVEGVLQLVVQHRQDSVVEL